MTAWVGGRHRLGTPPGCCGWTPLPANVDRTWRNPNLLVRHRQLWAIDHAGGAGLPATPGLIAYVRAVKVYDLSEHVLLPMARRLDAAAWAELDAVRAAATTEPVLREVLDVPTSGCST